MAVVLFTEEGDNCPGDYTQPLPMTGPDQRGGRCASCIHAGVLSCFMDRFTEIKQAVPCYLSVRMRLKFPLYPLWLSNVFLTCRCCCVKRRIGVPGWPLLDSIHPFTGSFTIKKLNGSPMKCLLSTRTMSSVRMEVSYYQIEAKFRSGRGVSNIRLKIRPLTNLPFCTC